MSGMINTFLELSITFRAFIVLLLFFILWGILGKKILFIFSVFPYGLGKALRAICLVIEVPIAAIHKRVGGGFYKINNQLSKIGNKIDDKINAWYTSWHSQQSKHMVIVFGICVSLLLFIALPSFIKTENTVLKTGQNGYLKVESMGIEWLKCRSLYDNDNIETSSFNDEQAETQDTETETVIEFMEETLIVSGLNTSLVVRDIPSIENSNKLALLYNGDEVIWNGQMAFSEVEGHVESWVKIVTSDGVEGWSRFSYLHPVQYENVEYTVTR